MSKSWQYAIRKLYIDATTEVLVQMKANALYTLNGGASCAQTYISQHRFFTETPDYNFDHDDATIAMIKMG